MGPNMPTGGNTPPTPIGNAPSAAAGPDEATVTRQLIQIVTALPLQAKLILLKALAKAPMAGNTPPGPGLQGAINNRIGSGGGTPPPGGGMM